MRIIVENRETVLNEIITRNFDLLFVQLSNLQTVEVLALILVHLANVIQRPRNIEREILEEMQSALQIDHEGRTHTHFFEKRVYSVTRDYQRILKKLKRFLSKFIKSYAEFFIEKLR